MRYAELRDRLEAALHAEGLFSPGTDRRVETIDVADTVRTWQVNVYRAARDDTKPFDVSAVTRVRYSPPLPGAKPTGPWFDNQSEDDDDDGGPDTLH